MTQPPDEPELAMAIRAMYLAPLEDFITQRDALVKQLRVAKRRDEATLVKALRKPGRMAWALDGVTREDPASLERLAAAIGAAQSGDNLPVAFERLKEAVRDVAAAAARVALRSGHPIEPNALVAAVHAIIGDATAFAELRAGHLVDIPEGGGLDLLIALTARPAPARPAAPPMVAATPVEAPAAIEPARPDPRIELAAAARAELDRTERLLADVRDASERATGAVRDAEAALHRAEEELRRVQSERDARRQDADRARGAAELAAARLDEARRAVDAARVRLAEFD